MKELKALLSNYIIFKDENREVYYTVKDNIKNFKPFITEKLGYDLIVRGEFIKLEKIPGKSESFMGIEEFNSEKEYVFLMLLLMFLEDKGKDEQFLLSHITEFIASNGTGDRVEWTDYFTRRSLIKVLKFSVKNNLVKINDGNEESFASDTDKEVLFESTGISRYMVRNLNITLGEETSVKDLIEGDYGNFDGDKGVLRRYRVYRRLLLSPIVYKEEGYEEDYDYIRNYRNIIQDDFNKYLQWNLHVHKNGAMLIPTENNLNGFTAFPNNKGITDVILHLTKEINKKIRANSIEKNVEDICIVTKEEFEDLITNVKNNKCQGWSKELRDMSTAKLIYEVIDCMEEMSMIKEKGESIYILPLCGKIQGDYPEDYKGEQVNE